MENIREQEFQALPQMELALLTGSLFIANRWSVVIDYTPPPPSDLVTSEDDWLEYIYFVVPE